VNGYLDVTESILGLFKTFYGQMNHIFLKTAFLINIIIRAGPIPILSIGYRPILQAFRYVPIPKNLQILLSEKYLNSIEQAASRKAPTLVFQENWLDNNLWTCYTYSGEEELKDLLKENYPLRYADDHGRSPQ
jgi:hypothetical protein